METEKELIEENKRLSQLLVPEHWKKPNWFSVKIAKNCLYSRRLGYKGKLFLGLSICLRINGKDLI